MITFNYDLGQDWKMQQIIDNKVNKNGELIETIVFKNNKTDEYIVLEDISVKKLRNVFKQLNQ